MRTEENNISIEMWNEHNVTHVRVHDYDKGRQLWDAFDTYTEAGRAFDRCVNFFHKKTARKPMGILLNRDGSKLMGDVACGHYHSNGYYMNANTRLTTK